MPAIPNISHPKLDGRKITPWANFTAEYHQEEERLPFFLPDRNEVWEARLFTQKKGSDRGTKKAGLRFLGTMSEETYAKFGIAPPTVDSKDTGLVGPAAPGAKPALPSAFFGTTPSTQLSAGPVAGTTTTGIVPTVPPSNTARPPSNSSTAPPPADTSWLDGIRNQFQSLANTVGGFVNNLNIPGVTIPTTPPIANNNANPSTNNQAAGTTGTTAQADTSSSAAQLNTGTMLIVGAAAVGLFLLYRRAK